MAFAEDLLPEERATVELAAQLSDSGNLHPLIARLRDSEIGPEPARRTASPGRARPDLLVQITLDGLISAYLQDPGLAHQPRRVVHANESDPG